MDSARFFDALADAPNLRSMPFADVEMTESAKGFRFDGIAAPVGVVADLGEFTEEYERGSFRRFLATCKDNVPFLHEHNPRDLLATTRSGRLRLSEEPKGLRVEADVVKTSLSERIKALVDSGDIGGMSIGMVVGGNAKIEQRADGRAHRRITNLRRLLDVCTTFDPAYLATEAQFRSAAGLESVSPASVQQLLSGEYPQLEEQGDDPNGTDEEPPTQEETIPGLEPEDEEKQEDGEPAGVAEHRTVSVAARRRALDLLILETGGLDNASG